MPGRVVEQTGPVSYRVEVFGQVWRRHTDQLLDQKSPESMTETETELIQADMSLPKIPDSVYIHRD